MEEHYNPRGGRTVRWTDGRTIKRTNCDKLVKIQSDGQTDKETNTPSQTPTQFVPAPTENGMGTPLTLKRNGNNTNVKTKWEQQH